MSTLEERADAKLAEVPAGRWTTYGDIAAALGQPGAGRAVGQAIGAGPQHNHNLRGSQWARSYQRLRMSDGSFKTPSDTVERALIERDNDALWVAEGGRFDAPGIYAASQRWEFGRPAPVTVTLTEEQVEAIARRVAARAERLNANH